MRWVNARKLKLTANFQVKERYRSGHNGADSKSDGRVIPAREFESHPLRQNKNGPVFQARFYFGGAGLVDDKFAGANLDARSAPEGRGPGWPESTHRVRQNRRRRFWTTRTRRSGAKRRTSGRPRPRAISPVGNLCHGFLQHFLCNATALECISQFARCVLIELHLIPAQSLANVALQ